MNKNAYLIELSESDQTDFGRVDFANQPEQQKVFSAVYDLESQVNNGGFLQYFGSSDDNAAEFAPKALRAIGANRCADIVDRALRTLSPSQLPSSSSTCAELVDALSDEDREPFDALDSEFYCYPDNLTDLLFAYVAAYPTVFGPTPH